MPDEPEAQGLLALMLLHDSRRRRASRGGELVLLADQDRSLWDDGEIAAGRAALARAIALRGRGPYITQAAIAALHTEQPTDWPQIAALYGELARLTDSPVVELNRAVAVAEAGDPEAGLAIADGLELDGYLYLHSTRASCCAGLPRSEEARAAFGERWSWWRTRPSGGCSNGASPSGVKAGLRAAEVSLERLSIHRAAIPRPGGGGARRGLLDERFLLHRGAGYSVHDVTFDLSRRRGRARRQRLQRHRRRGCRSRSRRGTWAGRGCPEGGSQKPVLEAGTR